MVHWVMIEKLKERFDSLLKVFEILYVAEGIKPAARIMVIEDQYKDIKKFLEKFSLYADRADFKTLKLDKGCFSNKGERINIYDKRKGHYFLYLSKNKNLVKKVKEYEEKNDHVKLGLALGYPKCCCKFFDKNSKTQERRFNDYILPALEASNGIIFPFYNNYTARYFDFALLSHFPCNFDCKKSLAIAKKHLTIIEKYSKEYAAIVKGMLKGAVVYTENYGVFLLRNSRISGNEIKYNTIIGNRDNNFSHVLKKSNKVEVTDRHHIRVGGKEIKTKNIGVMFFI